MVHVSAKFRENTSMRFRVTVQKINVTDGRTDRWTDGQTDEGIAISPVPGLWRGGRLINIPFYNRNCMIILDEHISRRN